MEDYKISEELKPSFGGQLYVIMTLNSRCKSWILVCSTYILIEF